MSSYPKRDKFFSHKFTRQLTKMCVANELGTDVFTLLVVIAHTEDAKRYQGPVSWYNEQLLPICGMRNVKALDRARTAAVEAGWLHYEPGGKSKPGRYWVLIGGGDISLDSNATDLEEAVFPPGSLGEIDQANGIERELNGKRNGIETGLRGKNSDLNMGNSLPYPCPNTPNPLPSESCASEKQEAKNPGMSGFTIVDPAWDIPSVHAALRLWAEHYPSRRNGAPFTDVQAAILIANKAGEGWTPDVFVKSVRMSAGNGWATIKDHRKIEADAKRQDQSFAPKQPQRTEDVYQPITPPRSRRERQA